MVMPTMIPRNHPLASVNYEDNAFIAYRAGGYEHVTVQGKGAGVETGKAVALDIVKVARDTNSGIVDLPDVESRATLIEPDEFEIPFYFRVKDVRDATGGKLEIMEVIKDNKINIWDDTHLREEEVLLGFITHPVRYGSVKKALGEMKGETFHLRAITEMKGKVLF